MLDYEERINEYNKITNPNELLSFMDKYITYGIYGTDNKIYTNWEMDTNSEFQLAYQSNYELCDCDRLLKYGYGTCWDQVELERTWFTTHGYENKTFFIWFYFNKENNYITHTYLIYKDKNMNKYYYFENSDINNRGIKEFASYKDAIEYQKSKHIEFNKKSGNKIDEEVLKHLQIYEFKINKYKCNQEEYINNIINSKLIYENNIYKNI